MNVIERLEYELAYYDSAVHRFNHYTTRTPLFAFYSDHILKCIRNIWLGQKEASKYCSENVVIMETINYIGSIVPYFITYPNSYPEICQFWNIIINWSPRQFFPTNFEKQKFTHRGIDEYFITYPNSYTEICQFWDIIINWPPRQFFPTNFEKQKFTHRGIDEFDKTVIQEQCIRRQLFGFHKDQLIPKSFYDQIRSIGLQSYVYSPKSMKTMSRYDLFYLLLSLPSMF